MSSTGSDVCPFIGFFCFQETSSFPNSRDIEEIFKTNNTISLHVLWYVGKMLKSPAKRKIHSSLNLTMAPTSPFSPFSPGGPGKPCKGDKQTLWASKKGRSCAAALNCWSWKKKKKIHRHVNMCLWSSLTILKQCQWDAMWRRTH